jgi:hypothetical protein
MLKGFKQLKEGHFLTKTQTQHQTRALNCSTFYKLLRNSTDRGKVFFYAIVEMLSLL